MPPPVSAEPAAWHAGRTAASASQRRHAMCIKEEENCGPAGAVELAAAADAGTVDVLGPLIQSAQLHSEQPECMHVNVLVPLHSMQELASSLWRTLTFHRLVDRDAWEPVSATNSTPWWCLSGGSKVRVVPFDDTELQRSIKVVGSDSRDSTVCNGLEGCDPSRAKRLQKTTNFARFFLADILPDLKKAIWLDCDVLIQKDMRPLWESLPSTSAAAAATTERPLMAAFVEHVPLGRFYFSERTVASLWQQRYGKTLDTSAVSFNDGAIVLDLERWRELGVKDEVRWWMQQHRAADPALWKFGTQPIMLLLGYGRWLQLPIEWYMGDLGFKDMGKPAEKEAVVLHFDGEHKPWLPQRVSEVNLREHRVVNAWNSHLLQPYMPSAASVGWFSAPGARCLCSGPHVRGGGSAKGVSTCEIGPLSPGVSVPGLLWVPPRRASVVDDTGSFEEIFAPAAEASLPLADHLVEGFFSATGLAEPAHEILAPSLFTGGPAAIEILFFRPQRIAGVYLQAASSEHVVRGARLQYKRERSSSAADWHDACGLREPMKCDPKRGPSFTAGNSTVCWRIASCVGLEAKRWRIVDWIVDSEPKLLGNVWLSMAMR
eukprot:gnl/TRDRNA2_/TRDRNA2_130154_c1_seq1.p1 gnl/TRDRNA2_/TRDRNA2_130154_c1~~gnl/TRDRNA2_/TRDRNA2_130154_c1_seq1.p1  ORF type:complete len:654 (+),score=109.61 gnl/TRDRNA2_/TRDRNA2_130154_c1_seq1:159-1964(+)